MLLEYAGRPDGHAEVPDPYYDGTFARVYRLVDQGAEALLARIVEEHGLS
jgi:hypothetical protein